MVRRVLIEMIENMNALVLWDLRENYVRVCNLCRAAVFIVCSGIYAQPMVKCPAHGQSAIIKKMAAC